MYEGQALQKKSTCGDLPSSSVCLLFELTSSSSRTQPAPFLRRPAFF
jgi:hypothetical protein